MDRETQTFFIDPKYPRGYFMMAVMAVLVAEVRAVSAGPAARWVWYTLAALSFARYWWRHQVPYVEIGEQSLAVRLHPLGFSGEVDLHDVASIEKDEHDRYRIHRHDGPPVEIRLDYVLESSRDALEEALAAFGDRAAEAAESEAAETDPLQIELELEVTDVLDLHSFPPKEVRGLVRDYLDLAHEKGLRKLRIIHGKGTGTQRRIVRSILDKNPRVESYGDPPGEGGGWGATIVTLR